MRTKKSLQLTALMLGAVSAGLLGVQGAWALWGVHAPSDAGTVRAADFRVELNGMPMDVGGVTLQQEAALTPTTPLHASVHVANATDAGAPFTIEVVMGAASVDGTSSQVLADHLTVESAVAPSSGECAGADFGESASTHIAKGDAATFCLRVSLPDDAPATLQALSAGITLPLTATQLPLGP